MPLLTDKYGGTQSPTVSLYTRPRRRSKTDGASAKLPSIVGKSIFRAFSVLGILAGLLMSAAPAWAQIDLKVNGVSGPRVGVQGQQVSVSVAILTAHQASASVGIRVYLTRDGQKTGARSVGDFGPFTVSQTAIHTETIPVTLPAGLDGNYYLAAEVDPLGQIAERNEYNNFTAATEDIRLRAPLPALSVDQVSLGTARALPGAQLRVSCRLRNQGELGAQATARVYLSREEVITPQDILLGQATNITLAPGAEDTRQIDVSLPAQIKTGTYHLGIVLVNDSATIEESTADNTSRAASPLVIYQEQLSLMTRSLPSATLEVPYNLYLQSAGGDGNYRYDIVSGSLPPGLRLDGNLGRIEGTPTQTGSFNAEARVRSDAREDRANYQLEVVATGVSLRVATTTVSVGYLSRDYHQRLLAFGGEAPYQWRHSGGELPPGLQVDGGDGELVGRPEALGEFDFTLEVEDRLGAKQSANYRMRVVTSPTVLILAENQPKAVLGQPLNYQLVAIGGRAPYSWEAVTALPPGVTLSREGVLGGTPERFGRWPLRVKVSDSTAAKVSDTALLEIDVSDPSDFRITSGALPPAGLRGYYSFVFTADGGTPPYRWQLSPGSLLPFEFFLVEGPEQNEAENTAVLYGRSFETGAWGFTIRVTDAAGRRREQPVSIYVPELNLGTGDGGGCRCTEPVGAKSLPIYLGALLLLPLIWRRGRRRTRC